MAAGNGSSSQSLEYTPTWAVATVCFFIISVSILMEYSIHLLTHWLKKRKKTSLYEAVDRLKSELMLLGFMSLLLAVTQVPISNICITEKMGDTMLPCHKIETRTVENYELEYLSVGRNLLNLIISRFLAEDDEASTTTTTTTAAAAGSCPQGKVSLISEQGIQQLQIFIIVLAAMQIIYTLLTMALGRLKMKRWKAWEKETQTTEYLVANDPNRFRFTRQTTFGRRHLNFTTKTSFLLWAKCFCRQFFSSVAKVDYLTLRHGFIAAHSSTRNNNFDFQKYIQRSLDEDFKVVVSISPVMWFIVVIFMLVGVQGELACICGVSYVPLLVVLILGTKLEEIVARMGLQLHNQNSVVIGAILVQPNDNLFWFGRPRFVLTLLHFTLFVNAFELAFFVWITIQFGWESCYHEHLWIIVTRIVLAVTVQVLCSYITLPLYALVTQMGSEYKSKALEEQMANIIKQWHGEVRAKRKKKEQNNNSCVQSARNSLSKDDRTSLRDNSNSSSSSFDFFSRQRMATTPLPTEQQINPLPSTSTGEITEENFSQRV